VLAFHDHLVGTLGAFSGDHDPFLGHEVLAEFRHEMASYGNSVRLFGEGGATICKFKSMAFPNSHASKSLPRNGMAACSQSLKFLARPRHPWISPGVVVGEVADLKLCSHE
jgi:hypothetical protein